MGWGAALEPGGFGFGFGFGFGLRALAFDYPFSRLRGKVPVGRMGELLKALKAPLTPTPLPQAGEGF